MWPPKTDCIFEISIDKYVDYAFFGVYIMNLKSIFGSRI